jgi:hypothetical protein
MVKHALCTNNCINSSEAHTAITQDALDDGPDDPPDRWPSPSVDQSKPTTGCLPIPIPAQVPLATARLRNASLSATPPLELHLLPMASAALATGSTQGTEPFTTFALSPLRHPKTAHSDMRQW